MTDEGCEDICKVEAREMGEEQEEVSTVGGMLGVDNIEVTGSMMTEESTLGSSIGNAGADGSDVAWLSKDSTAALDDTLNTQPGCFVFSQLKNLLNLPPKCFKDSLIERESPNTAILLALYITR